MFLPETQGGVDEQQGAHHDEIGVFAEHGGQHHDQFEHPRRYAPELAEKFAEGVILFFGHFIETVLLPAEIHLCQRESGFGIDRKGRERFRSHHKSLDQRAVNSSDAALRGGELGPETVLRVRGINHPFGLLAGGLSLERVPMNLPRTNVGRTATQEYGVFPGKSGILGAARCLAGVIGIAHG